MRLYDNNKVKICDVIPDLSVFCDLDEDDYDKVFIEKIPKIIIEIVSPSSVYLDNIKKATLYKEVGVLEYWIVDIKRKMITVWDFRLAEQYIYFNDDTLKSCLFEGLNINLKDLF